MKQPPTKQHGTKKILCCAEAKAMIEASLQLLAMGYLSDQQVVDLADGAQKYVGECRFILTRED